MFFPRGSTFVRLYICLLNVYLSVVYVYKCNYHLFDKQPRKDVPFAYHRQCYIYVHTIIIHLIHFNGPGQFSYIEFRFTSL